MLFEFLTSFFVVFPVSPITMYLLASNSFLSEFLLLIFWRLENKIAKPDGFLCKIRIGHLLKIWHLYTVKPWQVERRKGEDTHFGSSAVPSSCSPIPQSQVCDPRPTAFLQWKFMFYTVILIGDAAAQSFHHQGKHFNIFIFYLLQNWFQKQNKHIQIISLK